MAAGVAGVDAHDLREQEAVVALQLRRGDVYVLAHRARGRGEVSEVGGRFDGNVEGTQLGRVDRLHGTRGTGSAGKSEGSLVSPAHPRRVEHGYDQLPPTQPAGRVVGAQPVTGGSD
eukprot:514187-Hanusia_phi.AAC.1